MYMISMNLFEMKDEELRYTWPLHWAVFTSDLESLKKTLEKPDSGIDIDKVLR